MTPTDTNSEPASGWSAWTASERESFFVAIARHRGASWRVTIASAVAIVIVAAIVATLLAPLFYAAIALGFDIVNLITPAPNIVQSIGKVVGPMFDDPASVALVLWLQLAGVAAIPGLIWMAFIVFATRRMLIAASTSGVGNLARAINPLVLAEQRLADVISEMAVAANLPAPNVEVTSQPIVNAAILGGDERHARVVVSEELISRLNRDELQGVAAHLIGSIANGDMTIGLRAAGALSLFGLVSRMAGIFAEGKRGRHLWAIARGALAPTAARAREYTTEIADPFLETSPKETSKPATKTGKYIDASGNRAQVRKMIWLPLAGPVVMTGFFAGIANMFALGPLVALAWRQRKYMADATAVRLTRDPDALAHALEKIGGSGAAFAPWAAHLSVVQPGGGRSGLIGASVVPMFPSLDRRLRALAKLGAHLTRPPRRMPLLLVIAITPLFVIVGALAALLLFLLVFLSTGLTMLLTGLPFGIIHLILRWLGH